MDLTLVLQGVLIEIIVVLICSIFAGLLKRWRRK